MTARANERGFTLIELLIALSVFAIAALALMKLNGFSIRTTADLDDRMLARIVAQNAAVVALTDRGAVVRGTSVSTIVNAGRRFTVQRRNAPTDDTRLLQVDIVAVSQSSGARSAVTVLKRIG